MTITKLFLSNRLSSFNRSSRTHVFLLRRLWCVCAERRTLQNRIVAVSVSVPFRFQLMCPQSHPKQRSYQRDTRRVTVRSTRRQPATLLPQKMASGSGSEEVGLSEMEVDTAHVCTYYHCHDHHTHRQHNQHNHHTHLCGECLMVGVRVVQ